MKIKTYIEKGAIRRTTCCEFFGPFRLGIKAGSKSGGKYLFNTTLNVISKQQPDKYVINHLFFQTSLNDVIECR
jgi:hypothetical protein